MRKRDTFIKRRGRLLGPKGSTLKVFPIGVVTRQFLDPNLCRVLGLHLFNFFFFGVGPGAVNKLLYYGARQHCFSSWTF